VRTLGERTMERRATIAVATVSETVIPMQWTPGLGQRHNIGRAKHTCT
jgi:hypothetical protein